MELESALTARGVQAPPAGQMVRAAIIARIQDCPHAVDASAWNAPLAQQSHPTPFMCHEYLAALLASGSATPRSGWTNAYYAVATVLEHINTITLKAVECGMLRRPEEEMAQGGSWTGCGPLLQISATARASMASS